MRRHTWKASFTAAATCAALLLSACQNAPSTGPSTSPGAGTDFSGDNCTPVITAVSPEKVAMLTRLAAEFKNSPQHESLGKCATVHPVEVSSGEAARLLKLSGPLWPSSETVKPRPTLWTPASSAWIDQVAAVNGAALVPDAQSFTRTPVVFAMPERMARTLGWPEKKIGIKDLHNLCVNPDGWGSQGGAAGQWGRFKLGKTNPNSSTTGLATLIMQSYAASGKTAGLTPADVASAEKFSREFESCVIHYGDTTGNVLKRVYDRDAEGRPLDYVSAIAVEEVSVIAYNQGNPNTRALSDEEVAKLVRPREKLVAVYPAEGSLTSDNPIVALGGPKADWVSAEQATAGRAFIEFLLSDRVQDDLDEYGFRPLDAQRAVTGLFTEQYGVDAKQPTTWLEKPSVPVSFAATEQWDKIRKPSSVLMLIDVSGSMAESAGAGKTRLEAAVDSAQNTLGHFRSSDQLGVWTFTTGGVYKSDGTYQVRAVKPLGGDLENLLRELKNLVPLRGTPLYDAVRKGHATMTKRAEPGRINAIILLSDGDDAGSRLSQAALIAGLNSTGEGGGDAAVRVFPIIYGQGVSEAGRNALASIAEASGGQVFDASDPRRIAEVFQSVVNNF